MGASCGICGISIARTSPSDAGQRSRTRLRMPSGPIQFSRRGSTRWLDSECAGQPRRCRSAHAPCRTRTVTERDYVELRCRSAFSFLAGASLPEDLVTRAAALGHDTIALADRNGLYGAPRFFQAAKAAGLRAIVGADVAVDGGGTLHLLVESRTGYTNLCRLLTAGALGRKKGEGRVTWEEVEAH